MYPVKDTLQEHKVAWVHGLTGGELEDRPLRIFDPARGHRMWARYHYDGAPEWSEEYAYNGGRRGAWRTLVWDSGSYGDFLPPTSFRDSSGRRWHRVNIYNSGAECDCPVPENTGAKVTRKEARLTPRLSDDSPLRYWIGKDKTYTARRAECPMCEARIGEEHGIIYLGEGWVEAVYYSPDKD